MPVEYDVAPAAGHVAVEATNCQYVAEQPNAPTTGLSVHVSVLEMFVVAHEPDGAAVVVVGAEVSFASQTGVAVLRRGVDGA